METGACIHYPATVMDKLAALYQVPVEELLDEYNLFLYKGQARQIIALREKLGLSRTAFARQFGISASAPCGHGRRGRRLSVRGVGRGIFRD